MVESPLAFHVPQMWLELRAQELRDEAARDIAASAGHGVKSELLLPLAEDYDRRAALYEEKRDCFKTSSQKEDNDLMAIPTNLHAHTMYVQSTYKNSFSVLKSVQHLIVTLDEQLLRQNTSYEDPDEEEASEEKEAKKEKKDKKKKNPYASDLSFMIKQRMDFALPQALAGMLCVVLRQIQAVAETELRCKTQGTRRFLTNLTNLGILMGWESLVSTQGKELGMLADMQASVMELSNVRLKFVPPAGWTRPSEKTQAKDESIESQSDEITQEGKSTP
eukprot:gene5510-6676_t